MEGFIIRCGPGSEEVVVTDAQAEKIAARCDYFKHVFAHGTKESMERILVKPDWSFWTTKSLVELIINSKTNIESLDEFELLEVAAEQILLEIKLAIPSFVKRGKIVKERELTPKLLAETAVNRKLEGPAISLQIDSELPHVRHLARALSQSDRTR
jgi:hypothetical protein